MLLPLLAPTPHPLLPLNNSIVSGMWFSGRLDPLIPSWSHLFLVPSFIQHVFIECHRCASVLGNVRGQRLTNCRLPTGGPASPNSLSERWPSGFDLETKTYSIFKLTIGRIMPSRSSWFAWGARPSRHTSTAPGGEWIVLRGPRRGLSAFRDHPAKTDYLLLCFRNQIIRRIKQNPICF